MAKRRTRQLIIDRIEAADKFLGHAEDRLAQASGLYYEAGAKEGALVDLLRQGVKAAQDGVQRFRREVA
tara:strand:+ start:784 stop:990 length:207 start_codon:yes stop_codon:yes gene_type:complete